MSYLLSSTNSVNDVKAVIQRTYSQLGFTSDAAYIAAIGVVSIDTYLIELRPIVGESLYSEIQAKDKTSLEDNETLIYWAEVNFLASYILDQRDSDQMQSSKGKDESFSAEGYSQSIGDASQNGYAKMSLRFFKKAKEYLTLVGYDVSIRLKRGGRFYTDESSTINEFGVVE